VVSKLKSVPAPATSELPRGERAYEFIRDAIQQGRLKPGDRLREIELAEQIGLSRTPVREALARLEADGVIANDPVRGLTVTRLDYNMVSELYVMREILEGTAARLAAQHASEVELDILAEICAQYAQCEGDPAALAAKNRQFHDALYRCSHNRYLLKMLSALHDAMALLGDTTLTNLERVEKTLEEHAAIIAAVTERDADRAERVTREHIRSAQKLRLARLLADETQSNK
jgi:DNA-binding GntR family transcriptional regulator